MGVMDSKISAQRWAMRLRADDLAERLEENAAELDTDAYARVAVLRESARRLRTLQRLDSAVNGTSN